MRILTDLAETQLRSLNEIAKRENLSRAALIRQAVDDYLAKRIPQAETAFGLWGKRKVDGLEYQQRIRDEW